MVGPTSYSYLVLHTSLLLVYGTDSSVLILLGYQVGPRPTTMIIWPLWSIVWLQYSKYHIWLMISYQTGTRLADQILHIPHTHFVYSTDSVLILLDYQ